MIVSRWTLPLASFLLFCVAVAGAEEARVTVSGVVIDADGSPAAEVTVVSPVSLEEPAGSARADREGRFQLSGVFAGGVQLHARSHDGTQQTTRMMIPAARVRIASANPIELKLEPAIAHEVTVVADGQAVENAIVKASGAMFAVQGVTDREGKVRLLVPPSEPVRRLVAWHPERGVRGMRGLEKSPRRDKTQLTLLPPSPLTIRAIDPDGKPVPGLELGVGVADKSLEWASTGTIDAARVRTDAEGRALVPWAPREGLRYVDVDILDRDRKIDAIDLETLAERLVTVRVRRKVAVEGRLVMPEGKSAAALLVTAYGFGPGNRGDVRAARARADGSFTLRVAPDHGFVVGIVDQEWAGDIWSGKILADETSKPAEIAIPVARATPLTVRVSRGPRHDPVADAWVEVGVRADVNWVDSTGQKKKGSAGIDSWLRTDASGKAEAGVARGKVRVRLGSGTWNEERTVVVSSDKPVDVAFHRAWQGERQVTGRLTGDGKPFEPSPTLVARARAPQGRYVPLKFTPEVAPDGTFKVTFDAESLVLFFNDAGHRRSGCLTLDGDESPVDLAMTPMATYAGTVRDETAAPLAGRALTLTVKGSGGESVATETTDAAGRFRFPAVPAGVPLALYLDDASTRSGYHLSDSDRLFTPGEVREGDDIRPRRLNSPQPAPPALPLADRVATTCRNVGPAGMRALVVLKGDDSKNVATLASQLMDYEQNHSILKYLPVLVEPSELELGAETLGKYGWTSPPAGSVVLAALDGSGKAIGSTTIPADPHDALTAAARFLDQHASPTRDALAALASAREEARKSGRRVWVVEGGPRCGPCFRLGRWMEEQHATLEKDYVMVKVMSGLDDHASEAVRSLPIADGDGIPWHAITEPDGTILVTSHGPLGNIGFPSSVEGLRHLRRMLALTTRHLSATEVDDLIGSLEPGR